jgi:hypothetical protein
MTAFPHSPGPRVLDSIHDAVQDVLDPCFSQVPEVISHFLLQGIVNHLINNLCYRFLVLIWQFGLTEDVRTESFVRPLEMAQLLNLAAAIRLARIARPSQYWHDRPRLVEKRTMIRKTHVQVNPTSLVAFYTL